ncbi:lipid droplet-associated hydrolase isoform X2 [Ricinus communis]|uniref:lipid droplet-associated hydrolase isoform X2 n=1 Tax=Ricinus communis TaxID=3988 RepID=UPI00201AB982|nr:lipid droplet-associated hydrolase isoform X2 [Ricinus communis]
MGLLHFLSCYTKILPLSLFFTNNCRSKYKRRGMNLENSHSTLKSTVDFRVCNVSGYKTELLEICSDDPRLHILFIPGNPGVVSFYKDFLGSLYEFLGRSASVTAIGHISHTAKVLDFANAEFKSGCLFVLKLSLKRRSMICIIICNDLCCFLLLYGRHALQCNYFNWELGKLFSLEQQIEHKVEFIKQELQNVEVPIMLVGHSIGSYISLETLRRSPKKLRFCVGLYPFLMFNPLSEKQTSIQKIAESPVLSALISFSIASVGVLPRCASRLIVSKSIGKSWSISAVDAACSHLLQYHTFRNMIFMALTEFRKLSEKPDWAFMRENQSKIAFLFGVDDHWGPLEMYEEIAKQAPGIALSIEREGHMHNFCCTEAGSAWVAQHVANLLKNQVLSSSQ